MIKEAGRYTAYPLVSMTIRIFLFSRESAPQLRFSFPETLATFHQVVNPPGRLPPIKSQHPQFGPARDPIPTAARNESLK